MAQDDAEMNEWKGNTLNSKSYSVSYKNVKMYNSHISAGSAVYVYV